MKGEIGVRFNQVREEEEKKTIHLPLLDDGREKLSLEEKPP